MAAALGQAPILPMPEYGGKATYIDAVESIHAIGPIAKIGSSSPYHCSAVGKAILANLPNDKQAELLSRLELTRYTKHTITSRCALRTHLLQIRKQGFALNQEEEWQDVHGVAAPVFGHRGEVVGAICITIPSYRYEKSKLNNYAEAVTQAAAIISRRMGREG